MKKVLFVLALPVALSGCISFSTLVKVKPDGSGTIVTTTRMSAAMAKQLQDLGKSFSGGATSPPQILSEAEARAAVSKMGDGVAFLNAERVEDAGGVGIRATYTFKDVTRLHLVQSPGRPGSVDGGAEGKDEDAVRFKLAKNGPKSILTVTFPPREPAVAGKKKGKGAKDAAPSPDPKTVAQMKEIFKDLRFAMAVEVDGKLLKTTCPYVKGNTVTLMEMDFGKILGNEKIIERLAAEEDAGLERAKEILKGIDGIKVVLDPSVTIEMTAGA